jgi:CHAT domain-containing protein
MSQRDDDRLITWLNALIVLAQWDKSLPVYIARLFTKPEQYQRALELIRNPSQDSGPPATPSDRLNEGEWQKLYQFTTRAESIRKLFAAGCDPFQGANRDEIALLASISDLTTDPQTMFYSQNGTFQLVLETVRQRPELDNASLITDGLNKFYTLLDTNEAVAEQLYDLAGTDYWHVILASLYDGRDYTADDRPAAKTILEYWNKNLNVELRAILLKPTKLYRVPQKLIKIAWERRSLFKVAVNSIPPDKRLTGFELRQQISNVAYPLFVKEAKVEMEQIESDLQMLAMVALRYISVRKFVKLDGLLSGWPHIASLAMMNFQNLEYVEDFIVERKQPPSLEELEKRDARGLYERCVNDPKMISFLRFRPYFREINEDELRRYRSLAPVTISPAPSPPPPIIAPPAEDVGIAKAFTPTAVTPARVCELVIRVASPPEEFVVAEAEYEITLLVLGSEVAKGKTTFSIRKLLDRMLNTIGVTSEESLQSVMNSLFSGNSAEQVLVRGGAQLLNTFITQTGLKEPLADAFRSEEPVRLVITPEIDALHFLPWEWLPRPGYPELLLSSVRFSLVRSRLAQKEIPTMPLSSPVRILSLFPNSPVGTRDISETSINALEILTNEGAQYKPLVREHATLIRLTDELEKFRPHIVHFEGYVNPDDYKNVTVLLSSEESSTEAVHLSRFASLLSKNDVQLFVAGRNELNRTVYNPAAVIANRLADSAVPAVIAPIRAVDDATATSLVTEFYRAFIAGNNLEQALYTARRKVASRGGDWTSFALFANPSVLDYFQPLPPTP